MGGAVADRTTRALVVRGGWAGHEPVETTDRIVPRLKEAGFDVEISGSLDSYTDATLMKDIDLVVQCWTMGQATREQLAGLIAAVKAGAGLAGWHGGLCDSFREATEYQFMTGGQWVAHPGGKIDFRVNFLKDAGPIIAGLDDFDIHSEQYYMHVDPSNTVLATTTFAGVEDAPWTKGCVMPVAWERTYGQGKIFYTGLGHDASDFDVPQLPELIARGCVWASRRAVSAP